MSVLGYDRVKASFLALARSALPRADYMCAYRGIVVSQSGQTVDVRMEDTRIPGMSGLPIQIGIPAATVEVRSGARVLVAFEDGDPAKPIALLWDQGAQARRVSLPADLLELGGEAITEWIIKGVTYRAAQASLNTALVTQIGLAAAGLASAGGVSSHAAAQPFFSAAGTALAAAASALAAFEAQGSTFLSSTVRTK